MTLFVLGFVCGVAALIALGWWLSRYEPADFMALRSQRELAELERRTVQQMVAAEMAAARGPVSDAFEGSAIDLRPER